MENFNNSQCPDTPRAEFGDRIAAVSDSIENLLARCRPKLKEPDVRFTHDAIAAMVQSNGHSETRHFENVAARGILLAGGLEVRATDLYIAPALDEPMPPRTWDLRMATREFERRHIERAMARFANQKVQVAKALGIGLSSLYRKMEELGILRATTSGV